MDRALLAALATWALVMSPGSTTLAQGNEVDALAAGQQLKLHDRRIAVTIPAAWQVTTGSQGLPIIERAFVAREPDGPGRCFVETFAFDDARLCAPELPGQGQARVEAAEPSAPGQAGAEGDDDRTTEIPGTGLAVTLPGEWRVWSHPASGVSAVIASDVRTRRSCGFDRVQGAGSAEEAARDMLEGLEANRQVVVLDHSSVSAGAGDTVRVSYRMASLPDEPRFVIHEYYVTGPDGVASVRCQGVDPPADRWLSVVDALAVAGVEDVTQAPFDPRVEVPQHGFAVDLGAEWLVRDWAGPGALLGDVTGDDAGPQARSTAALRASTIGAGTMDQECFIEDDTGHPGLPGVDSLDEWQEVLAATTGTRGRQSSVPEVSGVDLESDRVVRADWSRWRGMPATAWVFADDERRVVLFCRADDPPADRWRSIAETFEFLPTDR